MKKSLFAILGLVCATCLAACNSSDTEENTVSLDNVDVVSGENDVELGEEEGKTSLTIEDLDEIDATLFPKGYTYTTTNYDNEDGEGVVTTGSYTYPEDVDHSLLLPIHETMASRTVTSSSIEDGMIYTMTEVTDKDGTVVSVLYINDPVTLQYVAAEIIYDEQDTNYQFVY